MSEPNNNRVVSGIREFFRLEASAGIVLLFAALLALVASNTPLSGLYDLVLNMPVEVRAGPLHIAKPLLLWINDGLMAIFFLLVGLEIKRELLEGELSSAAQAALPAIAALGGMLVPALIYASFNGADAESLRGWAIPTATDIAFAIGVLTLLGPRVPTGLKVFLVALAIIDDLGAIVIIALFYTSELSALSLLLGLGVLLVMVALNRLGVDRVAPYALLGVVLWVFVLKSGVHATLAGVATALAIPLRPRDREAPSPLKHLEHVLHPWVAFLVMPLFGFANAGVSFAGLTLGSAVGDIPLGIAAGLFVGKQVGTFGFSALAIRLGLAKLPDGTDWLGLYATCVLTGIGFTMSLFIGTLAWDSSTHADPVRLGVLAGSLASGLLGYGLLSFALRRRRAVPKAAE